MLDSMVNLFTAYVSYWPLACFIILVLAGCNVPVSEDALIIFSAGIAFTDRTLIIPNYLALIAGIYASDVISYFIGRLLSKGMRQIQFFRKKLTPKKIRLVSKTLDDYGFRTFIVCRFIPFGVRNTLFLCSGFVKLPIKSFILYDFIAGLISCTTLYSLVLFMGHKADIGYKIAGVILFILMLSFFIYKVIQVIKIESKSIEQEEAELSSTDSDL